MRLTKSTSHAIRILISCARADGRLLKVAEEYDRLAVLAEGRCTASASPVSYVAASQPE